MAERVLQTEPEGLPLRLPLLNFEYRSLRAEAVCGSPALDASAYLYSSSEEASDAIAQVIDA